MSGKLLLEGVAVGLGVESFKVFISTHFDYMKTAFLNIKIQLIGYLLYEIIQWQKSVKATAPSPPPPLRHAFTRVCAFERLEG